MSNDSPLIAVLRRNLFSALRAHRIEEAEALLAQLRAEDPLSMHTRGLELDLLVTARRWREAEALADQLQTLFPDSARVRFLVGRVRYQQHDYKQAKEHFRESARLHPSWWTRKWLGSTHTQLGEFAEAEALLLALLPEHPQVNSDLAWLYERRGEPARALRYVEAQLAGHPDDRFALAQRLRLKGRAAEPEALVEEVEGLEALDEEVPTALLPTYVQRLLETGQGQAARRFVRERAGGWTPRTAAAVAWPCHHLQAHDLAVELFLKGLALNAGRYKYLGALEADARQCHRLDDVIAAYAPLATEHRGLYGRIKRLERLLGPPPETDGAAP